MTIDQLIEQAENRFRKTFIGQLEQAGLLSSLQYCFPYFSTNFKKKVYQYDVSLRFRISLKPYQHYELSANGEEQLVETDPITGEKSIVISNSYEGKTIFRSSVPFHPADQPLLHEKDVHPDDFAGLDVGLLEINPDWETLFQLEEPDKGQ
jgi:hypothetical protein